MWNEVFESICGQPVYLDLSFVFGQLTNQDLLRLIEKHGADWIIFGTDSPWRSQAEDLASFQQLPLSDSQKELILWKNAIRLLDLDK